MDLGAPRSSRKSARAVRAFVLPGRTSVLVMIGMLLAAVPCRAQLLDSIRLFTRERPRLVVKLDSRGSFISNRNVSLMGVKVGLEHAGRFQYGIGYSFLSSNVEQVRILESGEQVQARLHMGYVCPYVEYAFFQRGPWEVRIPVQLGFGGASLRYAGEEGDRQQLRRAFVFLYEPSMTVQYRLLRYFGLNAGWGYRLVVTNDALGERLTAPIYVLGVKVFFGDLWKDLNR